MSDFLQEHVAVIPVLVPSKRATREGEIMETMETKVRGNYEGMSYVKAANHAAGFHFFEADTMAFFDSRVESGLMGGCLFVTSEQFHGSTEDGPRLYTVRIAMEDGSIDELGEFQEHESLEDAIAAAQEELGTDDEPEEDEESLEDLLDSDTAPEAIADLWRWSQNFEAGKGPATAFLDLIGYSEEEFGEGMYDFSNTQLGYLEIGKLGRALTEYAQNPTGVMWFVRQLLEAEMEH